MAENILITGARAPVALDMARDLKHADYSVFLADCSNSFMSKWSNTAQAFYPYTSPIHNIERFRSDIKDLINQLKPKLVIPTCEEVFHLAHPDLVNSFKGTLFAPSLDVLDQLHNKAKFNKLCVDLNLTTPETHVLTCYDDLKTYQDELKDWVFKPCYSRFGSQALIQPSKRAMKKVQLPSKNIWIAQKFITGIECSFYAVSHNGKLTAFSAYQSGWRLRGGASYVFEPVNSEMENQVRIIAEKIAYKLNLTAQFSCDLIIDSHETAWLIECNPRATSGLHLLTGCGDLARSIVEETMIETNLSRPRKYMLPMMISYGFTRAVIETRFREWLSTLKSGRDVISVKKDRLPLLGSVIDTLFFMKHAFKKNISLSQATTNDIKWNGE